MFHNWDYEIVVDITTVAISYSRGHVEWSTFHYKHSYRNASPAQKINHTGIIQYLKGRPIKQKRQWR